MDTLQLLHYKMAVELKIRRTFGVAFQDFISTVFERAHGADFVRVRPFGSLGDKGCDGYLSSNGRVFQCYGKLQDAAVSVSTLVAKIEDDFALAKANLGGLMKEWHFAHNLIDGVPTEALLKIEEIRAANPNVTIGLIGYPALEPMILGLDEANLLELLGPAATAEDSRSLNLHEVRDTVDAIIASIDTGLAVPGIIKPVPADKLTFNNLPNHWVGLIESGSKNAPHVREYFEKHPKAETGEIVSKEFTRRYRNLKLEGLQPGSIMTGLYVSAAGTGFVSPERQTAACAILAYLFDACEIFEDKPQALLGAT